MSALTDLENRFDRAIPPAALAAIRAEQPRRRSQVETISGDLEAAETALSDRRACLHFAVRERWAARQMLRAAQDEYTSRLAAEKLAETQQRAAFALKHFRSAGALVATHKRRLAAALRGIELGWDEAVRLATAGDVRAVE